MQQTKMKVNYNLNDAGYIVSYTASAFDESEPFIEIDSADIQYLMTQKCKVVDGKLDITDAQSMISEINLAEQRKAELMDLRKWFSYYDNQAVQYARHIRLHGESDIDIATLDAEAEAKAARIKELEALLAE